MESRSSGVNTHSFVRALPADESLQRRGPRISHWSNLLELAVELGTQTPAQVREIEDSLDLPEPPSPSLPKTRQRRDIEVGLPRADAQACSSSGDSSERGLPVKYRCNVDAQAASCKQGPYHNVEQPLKPVHFGMPAEWPAL